ncbi:MAG TPA: threonine dehydratase [Candidatus Baltobacteraceae bacterium]|nr:threonine dehydratase [Candidatus Baltobacteraceae bacterium]
MLRRDVVTRPAPFGLTLAEIDRAAALIRDAVPPTPAFRWPLLCERLGVDVTLKHENHTPTGAFKVRGGLTYVEALRRRAPHVTRLVCATRGNHGQSIAFAASRAGLRVTIVVPEGNSPEKNAAMRAFGAEVLVRGADFEAAQAHADLLAGDPNTARVPVYDRDLVSGVATCARELFAAGRFDVVYVPVGRGSGISGAIAVRNLLGLETEIVGVVSERYPVYAEAFAQRRSLELDPPASTTIADGVAIRTSDATALETILANVSRIVAVADDAIEEAMRAIFAATHNVAEGAGAAPVAAIAAQRARLAGKRVAAIVSGGNVDSDVFARVLAAR